MNNNAKALIIDCPICGRKNILNCEDVSCRECDSCRLDDKLCTCDKRLIIQNLLAQNIQLRWELDYSLQQDAITFVYNKNSDLTTTRVSWK